MKHCLDTSCVCAVVCWTLKLPAKTNYSIYSWSSSVTWTRCWISSHLHIEAIKGMRKKQNKSCAERCSKWTVGWHYFLFTEEASLEVAQSKGTHLTAICINVPIRFNCSLTEGTRHCSELFIPSWTRFQNFFKWGPQGNQEYSRKTRTLNKKTQIYQK